jgi:pilus assembly protein CpaB
MFGRFLLVGIASLALACGIALVFYKVTNAAGSPANVKTRKVVIATAELAIGTRIRPQDLRIASVPEEMAPQTSFEKLDDVKDRVVTNIILKDEPIVPNRLAPPGSAPGLAPMIPPGYRAVSVRVNDVIGVAGFIQPGMRVDVLASGRVPHSEDSVTRTVLQNVVVLSAGQVLTPEPKGQVINAQVVTLQVRPEEAEILMLTSGEGRIQLVLRNSADAAVARTPGANLKAIYNTVGSEPAVVSRRPSERPYTPTPKAMSAAMPPAPLQPTLPKPRPIEVIRGTSRSEVAAPGESEKPNAPETRKSTRGSYATYTLA